MNYYAAKMPECDDAILPTRDLETNCGWDLYAHRFEVPDEESVSTKVSLQHGDICKIYTGCAIALPDNYGAFFWDRSGHGSRGLHRLAGVIDWSYRGELILCVTFLGKGWYNLEKGDKPGQMIIQEVPKIEQIQLDYQKLKEITSKRGDKGFGSSGR